MTKGRPAGSSPGPVQQFVAQLRRMTADLESLTGLGGPLLPRAAIPLMPGLPMPGALSAKELKSIATNVTAQRRSIQALQVQLTAFEEQLGVLEGILGPLAEWSSRWAELEGLMVNLGRRPPKPDA